MISRNGRGYEVVVKDDWSEFYADNGEVFDDKRPCTKCNEPPTPEGHDACLGELPGVEAACCGHGVEEGYIKFKNGLTIRGNFKVEKNK